MLPMSPVYRYLCNRNGHKIDMARPNRETSNSPDADILFKTLEEWNVYLKNHVSGPDGLLT
jgi:hypothetical protein